MPQHIIDLITAIEDLDNDDTLLLQLEQATKIFCSMWDECEGYKYVIIKTLEDQYGNHGNEQDGEDVAELKRILDIN